MARDSDGMRDKILTRYTDRQRGYAQALAKRMGAPLASRKLTEEEQAQRWLHRVPGLDPDAMIAQGMPPVQVLRAVWPHRELLIGKGTATDRVERAEGLHKLAERYLQQQGEEPMSAIVEDQLA